MPNGPFHRAARVVLIIGDMMSEAMTLDLLCRSLGVETVCAANAAAAGAVLERVRPTAIIVDVTIPGADGRHCLLILAERAPKVPVMVVTGSEDALQQATAAFGLGDGSGKFEYVTKPVCINVLRTFVAQVGLVCKPSQWDLH